MAGPDGLSGAKRSKRLEVVVQALSAAATARRRGGTHFTSAMGANSSPAVNVPLLNPKLWLFWRAGQGLAPLSLVGAMARKPPTARAKIVAAPGGPLSCSPLSRRHDHRYQTGSHRRADPARGGSHPPVGPQNRGLPRARCAWSSASSGRRISFARSRWRPSRGWNRSPRC